MQAVKTELGVCLLDVRETAYTGYCNAGQRNDKFN